jgi:flagellar hook-basal body complex protein FliE
MRELTKSIFSFSWAMSLFGIQQTANLTSPQKAAHAFDTIAEATEEQLSEVLRSTFSAGDKLQRSGVDLTLGLIAGDAPNANQWVRTASNAAKQSLEAVTRVAQGVTTTVRQTTSSNTSQGTAPESASVAGNASSTQRQGWGPMPS